MADIIILWIKNRQKHSNENPAEIKVSNINSQVICLNIITRSLPAY